MAFWTTLSEALEVNTTAPYVVIGLIIMAYIYLMAYLAYNLRIFRFANHESFRCFNNG